MNVPTLGGLLKSINGPMQLVYHMLLALSYETVWLHHIDVFLKISIQKYNLDIHLPNFIIEMCHNGQENLNKLKHGNR